MLILKLNLVKIGEIMFHECTQAKHAQLNLAKFETLWQIKLFTVFYWN